MDHQQKILLNLYTKNLQSLYIERNKYYNEGRLERVANIDKKIFAKKLKIKEYKRRLGL